MAKQYAIDALTKAPHVKTPLAQAAILIAGLADGYVLAMRREDDKENDSTHARVLLQAAFEMLHRHEESGDFAVETEQRDYDTAENYLEAVGHRFEESGGEW